MVVGAEVIAPWEFLPCGSHTAQQDRGVKIRERKEEDDEAKEEKLEEGDLKSCSRILFSILYTYRKMVLLLEENLACFLSMKRSTPSPEPE